MHYNFTAARRTSLALVFMLGLVCAVSAQSQDSIDAFKKGYACEDTDYDCQIKNFTKAIELDPSHLEAYIARGYAYRQKKSSALALADFGKVLELDPDLSKVYYFRGIVYVDEGKLDLAITDFSKAIRLRPDIPDLYNDRGYIYRRMGNDRLALEDFNKAIEMFGDSPKAYSAYFNRGLLRCSQGCSDIAFADYNKAIELNPNFAPAYVERGSVYDYRRRFDLALADYDRALQLNPNLPRAHNGRGWVFHQQRDFDRAISEYNKAISVDPDYATAYCNRGVAYSAIGEFDLAIKDDTKALELDPNLNDEIYRSRALAYFFKNDGENSYRDTVTYLKRNGLKGEAAPYGIMIGYLGLRKAGNSEVSGTFLKGWLKLLAPDAWSTQILRYFDGQLTAEELLELANDNDKMTEAHTYIGVLLSSENRKTEAFEHLQWVKQYGNRDFIEYQIALVEINR